MLSTRSYLLHVVGLAAVCFIVPLFLALPLVDPDEGLHASIAQEMVEGGNWVMPTFLGKPFLDKPIFYFWCQAISLSLFGMNEAAIRLPGLLFGFLGALTTGVVATRMFSLRVGQLAGTMYATLILPLALCQVAVHDIAIVPWISLALLCFWEADRYAKLAESEAADRTRHRKGSLAFYAAAGVLLGLATLTKGLVGVALVGLAYGAYLILAWRLRPWAILGGALSLVIAALIASPWYIAMEFEQPGYNYYYFVQRHLLGYVSEGQIHGKAKWWYYAPVIFGGGLPWISFLPIAVIDRWKRREGWRIAGSALAFVWIALATMLLFLNAGQSKLATYVLPCFPLIAMLAAEGWNSYLDGRMVPVAQKWLSRTVVSSCWLGPLVMPLAALVASRKFDDAITWFEWVAIFAASMISWVPLSYWRRYRPVATLNAMHWSMAAHFVLLMCVIFPPLAEGHSARTLAFYFNRQGCVPEHLYLMNERLGSLVFYLDKPLRAGLKADQIDAVPLAEWQGTLSVPRGSVLASQPIRKGRFQKEFDKVAYVIDRADTWTLYRPRVELAEQAKPGEQR